jgi:hypothetical protein
MRGRREQQRDEGLDGGRADFQARDPDFDLWEFGAQLCPFRQSAWQWPCIGVVMLLLLAKGHHRDAQAQPVP